MFSVNLFLGYPALQEGSFKEDETDEACSTLAYGEDAVHSGFRRKLRRKEINWLLKN